jgi:putative transposase
MDTTIENTLRQIFSRDEVLNWARTTGAVERLRDVHPADLAAALVSCVLGDEERSIATARRQFNRISGLMPEESSFYDRFNSGLAALMKFLWLRALAHCKRGQRRRLARVLGVGIDDLRVVDATQAKLPARARETYPSTHMVRGGFKLTATLSLVQDVLVSARLTDARQHDRKAFRLGDDVQGVLHLFDRGYCDHHLFDDIDRAGGFFLVRLKGSSIPRLRGVRSGLGRKHIGQRLDDALPYRGIVDVDADFNLGGGKARTFRMVSIPVRCRKKGRMRTTYVEFVTNLTAERFSAEAIGELYRLRYAVETFFKILKTVGRFDQIQSEKPAIVEAFAFATLLGVTIAHGVCAAMRTERPRIEPSPFRVALVTLGYLPSLIRALQTDNLDTILAQFIRALWREGVNPNPGRPYATTRHVVSVEKCA